MKKILRESQTSWSLEDTPINARRIVIYGQSITTGLKDTTFIVKFVDPGYTLTVPAKRSTRFYSSWPLVVWELKVRHRVRIEKIKWEM